MGNSSSSGRGHHEDTVDFGHLSPQGIYTGPRDWNQQVVASLIVERRLSPFYRPLEDYEEGWDDDRILAARKELPEPDANGSSGESGGTLTPKSHSKRPSASKELGKFSEGIIYRGAVDCPICFLYYPPHMNRSRCCDQAICTECFVQIKRAEPTATHLVSEPAACPYCMQENFGVTYTPPPWRTGLGSDGSHSPSRQDFESSHLRRVASANLETSGKRRRRSFGPDAPEVVTVDHIRPDWEQKLAAVRAAVTRRANRRIIMRQVGDRLIPVGVTSGRVHALPEGAEGLAEGTDGGGSRRSRRRGAGDYPGTVIAGQDLEELMIMEAMRLSLLDEEERQRKEREEQKKNPTHLPAEPNFVEGTSQSGLPSSAPSSLPSAMLPFSAGTSAHHAPMPTTASLLNTTLNTTHTTPDSSTPRPGPSPAPALSTTTPDLQSTGKGSTAAESRPLGSEAVPQTQDSGSSTDSESSIATPLTVGASYTTLTSSSESSSAAHLSQQPLLSSSDAESQTTE